MRVNFRSSSLPMRVSGPMISCTSPPEQKFPPAPVMTSDFTSRARAKTAEQIAQLGIGIKRQRILALRAIQRHNADLILQTPEEMLRLQSCA